MKYCFIGVESSDAGEDFRLLSLAPKRPRLQRPLEHLFHNHPTIRCITASKFLFSSRHPP